MGFKGAAPDGDTPQAQGAGSGQLLQWFPPAQEQEVGDMG